MCEDNGHVGVIQSAQPVHFSVSETCKETLEEHEDAYNDGLLNTLVAVCGLGSTWARGSVFSNGFYTFFSIKDLHHLFELIYIFDIFDIYSLMQQ